MTIPNSILVKMTVVGGALLAASQMPQAGAVNNTATTVATVDATPTATATAKPTSTPTPPPRCYPRDCLGCGMG